MNAWRPVLPAAGAALVGGLGSLAVGALAGMGLGELGHLAALLVPAAAATVVAVALARRMLRRASFRQRSLGIVLTAAMVSLGNIGALAVLMLVSPHDALLMSILLVYSASAGVGAAVALSRGQTSAVERLGAVAGRLAEGHLDARVGRLHAGPELDGLGEGLDRMAERVQRSIAAERAAERTRRDLITSVSHDLRTPLASLRVMAEAASDGVVEDAATLRRYAGEMLRQVEMLTVLVDDLFELVQLDAGAIDADAPPARLVDVVGSAVAACEVHAAQRGVLLRHRLDGAEDTPCSPRLVRVLQNLLQNAIRHTPAHGTVYIDAAGREGAVELAVEDTGEGIAPYDLHRVFEPFWRADAARSTPGSGLGLALAKRIVEALGGVIRVESKPAEGSRFSVTIPA